MGCASSRLTLLVLLDHAHFLLLQVGFDVLEGLDAQGGVDGRVEQQGVVELLEAGAHHQLVVTDAHKAQRLKGVVANVGVWMVHEVHQCVKHLIGNVLLLVKEIRGFIKHSTPQEAFKMFPFFVSWHNNIKSAILEHVL